jgi:hypothetical protein
MCGRKHTVALLKNKVQTLTLSFLLKPLAPISSLMIGSGPQSESPMLPKSNGDVTRKPIPRGHATVGIAERWDRRDMIRCYLGRESGTSREDA